MSLFRYLHISLCLNLPSPSGVETPWLLGVVKNIMRCTKSWLCWGTAGQEEGKTLWGYCGGHGWQRGFRKRICMEYWGERSLVTVSSWVYMGKKQWEGSQPAFSFIHLKINIALSPERLLYFSFFRPFWYWCLKQNQELTLSRSWCRSPFADSFQQEFQGTPPFSGALSASGVVKAFKDNGAGVKMWKVWILLKIRAAFQPPKPWCCSALLRLLLVSSTFCSPKYFQIRN